MSILRDSKHIDNAGDVIQRDMEGPVRTPPAALVAVHGLTTLVAGPAHQQALLDRADDGVDSSGPAGEISLAVAHLNADAVACFTDDQPVAAVDFSSTRTVQQAEGLWSVTHLGSRTSYKSGDPLANYHSTQPLEATRNEESQTRAS